MPHKELVGIGLKDKIRSIFYYWNPFLVDELENQIKMYQGYIIPPEELERQLKEDLEDLDYIINYQI